MDSWRYEAEMAVVSQGVDPFLVLVEAQYKADLYRECMLAVDLTRLSKTELRDQVWSCAR